jgi:hypothetical protein
MVVGSFTSIAPAAAAVAVAVAAVIGGLLTVPDYRSRTRAQRAETNVRLAEAFANLMTLANGRDGGNILSESAVQRILESRAVGRLLDSLDQADAQNRDGIRDRLRNELEGAMLSGGVGLATQLAAISAVGELIRAHPDLLGHPGRAALGELRYQYAGRDALCHAIDAALARAVD